MTPQNVTYSADGNCATFGFDFPVFEPADLEVLLNGNVQTSGFTLLGVSSPEGGAVRFASAPAAGTAVTLRRAGKVQVSDSDAPGFLEAKVLAGTHITVTKTTDTAGEHLTIATDINPASFATAAQGAKAESALQPSALDTDVALSANSDEKIASQKAVKTYVDGMISTQLITGLDRNLITALGLMIASTQVSGQIQGGYRWKLSSDEWSTGSSNYTFTAGAPGSYSNQTSGYGSNLAVSANHIGNVPGTYTYLYDGDFSIDNGIVSPSSSKSGNYYVGQDFGAGNVKHIRRIGLGQVNWLRDIQAVKIQNADSPSGPWSDVFSTSSLPNHGTTTIDYIDLPASSAKRCWRVLQNEDQPDGFGWMIHELRMFEANTASTMTVVTPAIAVPTVPASASILFLWQDDCGTTVMGTDMTVELSRDGGTTWKPAVISYQEPFDGAYAVYNASIGLSDKPSGTSVTARFKALNSKAQRIGPAILSVR